MHKVASFVRDHLSFNNFKKMKMRSSSLRSSTDESDAGSRPPSYEGLYQGVRRTQRQVLVSLLLLSLSRRNPESFVVRRTSNFRMRTNHSLQVFTERNLQLSNVRRMMATTTMTRTTSRRYTHSPLQDSLQGQDGDHDGWKSGNVYRDLDILEREIKASTAQSNLEHANNIKRLESFAKERRPLIPFFVKQCLLPLLGGLALSRLPHMKMPQCKRGMKVFTSLVDAQFWMVFVIAPLCLLALKLMSTTRRESLESMPEALASLDEETRALSFLTILEWEDPRTSCKDHELFLLEYWASAIVGTAVIGCFLGATTFSADSMVIKQWWTLARLITKLGALASLHQYPNQLYALQRSSQPRPLGFFTHTMQYLVRSMTVFVPIGVASDLGNIFYNMSRHSLVSLFSTISLLITGTSLRMIVQKRKGDDRNELRKLKKPSIVDKLVFAFLSCVIWKRSIFLCLGEGRQVRSLLFVRAFKFCLIGMVSIIGPMIHIKNASKAVRVMFTHDLPLSLSPREFKVEMANCDTSQRVKWRFRLNQRDPTRLMVAIDRWYGNLDYQLLYKGSALDILQRSEYEERRKEMRKGKSILQRMERDLEEKPLYFFNNRYRTEWKTEAMERTRNMHRSDYEKKVYTDPLGIAVYKALGIGLGFNYDHMRCLSEGEKPSLRRLQSRAAKSAVARVQQIYNGQDLRKELALIKDSEERRKLKEKRIKEAEKEVENIGRRLAELIPVGADAEFDRTFTLFSVNRAYKKISDHEYLVDCSVPSTNEILASLFGKGGEPIEVSTDSGLLESFENYIEEKAKDEDDGEEKQGRDNLDKNSTEIIT